MNTTFPSALCLLLKETNYSHLSSALLCESARLVRKVAWRKSKTDHLLFLRGDECVWGEIRLGLHNRLKSWQHCPRTPWQAKPLILEQREREVVQGQRQQETVSDRGKNNKRRTKAQINRGEGHRYPSVKVDQCIWQQEEKCVCACLLTFY